MTKTTKAMLAGAALAGLFAGTGAAAKASALLPSLKTSFNAQDPDQKSDKQDKEKHACKGQNSRKGKGGCKASDTMAATARTLARARVVARPTGQRSLSNISVGYRLVSRGLDNFLAVFS